MSKFILRVLRKVLHKNRRKYYLKRAGKYNNNACVVSVGTGSESESDNRVPLLKFVAIFAGFFSGRSNKPQPPQSIFFFFFAIHAHLKNHRLNITQPRQNLYTPNPQKKKTPAHNGRPHYSITCCKNSRGIHKCTFGNRLLKINLGLSTKLRRRKNVFNYLLATCS